MIFYQLCAQYICYVRNTEHIRTSNDLDANKDLSKLKNLIITFWNF